MATYKKQNFTPEQILQAAHLNNIEDGVVMVEEKADTAQAHSENVEATLTQKLNDLDNTTSSNLSNAVSALNSTIDDLSSDTTDEFASVRSEMDTADAQLQSNINTLSNIHNADKASLQSSIRSTASAIRSEFTNADITIRTDMSTADESLQAAIDTHKSDVEAEFETLRQEIEDANSASVEYVDTQIGELVSVDKAHTSSIAQNAADIDALEETDLTHTEQISDTQSRLDSLEQTVAELPTKDSVEEIVNNAHVVPDYMQNDSTANDYIKNRTHYVYYQPEEVLPTTTVSGASALVESEFYFPIDTWNVIIGSYVSTVAYKVVFDGVEYVVESQHQTVTDSDGIQSTYKLLSVSGVFVLYDYGTCMKYRTYDDIEHTIQVFYLKATASPLADIWIPDTIQRKDDDFILISPNGSQYKLSVDDSGALSAVLVE